MVEKTLKCLLGQRSLETNSHCRNLQAIILNFILPFYLWHSLRRFSRKRAGVLWDWCFVFFCGGTDVCEVG